ncbi:MAG: hypothetical protein NTW19_19385 [Planctomycetota bacterium]|nr:hypothetical protein [Planctomycetota bacterium]
MSRKRLMLAMAVAGLSDLISLATGPMLPVQWVVDITTALLLWAILGWRWMLLPALIAEAIPVVEIMPFWVLVVASIGAFDKIQPHSAASIPGMLGQAVGGKPAGESQASDSGAASAELPRKQVISQVREPAG